MSILRLVVTFVLCSLKSQRQLTLENLALKQQVTMLRQSVKRPRASVADRLFWILYSRYVNGWSNILHALHPDTVVRWHRQGFRLYWRWKSRGPKPGRPPIDLALRKLIREMQANNVGWGAPRIHGELLKLGIDVSQATVSKYMQRSNKPLSQTWLTFLNNHTNDLASIDFFTAPTANFRVLTVLIVLSHNRRKVIHFNVTEHPTAQWTAQQLVEAFPFDPPPRHLLRDRDAIYGEKSSDELGVWASRRLSRHLALHGKILFVNALSGLAAGTVWTMSLYLMIDIYAESFASTLAITILAEHIYR